MPHYTEKVAIIELGSSAIRGGVLTKQPSLPQVFFPAIGCVTDSGEVFVGVDALKPKVRHYGALVRPIEAVESSVERYRLNKEVLKACIEKVVRELKIQPMHYKVDELFDSQPFLLGPPVNTSKPSSSIYRRTPSHPFG